MFQRPSPDIALSREEKDRHFENGHDDVETVVGPSVHVEGDFASEGNIIVKGTVSGNVKTSKLLTVEEGAKIFANVKAGSAHVSGEVRGNVKVDGQLELSGTARIAGDISCNVLVVEAGCLIQGKVSMRGLKIDDEHAEKKRGLGRMKRKTSEPEEVAQEEEMEAVSA